MQSSTKSRVRRALVVALTLGLVGCGPIRLGGASPPNDDTLVFFENNSTEQAAVYAVSGGEQQRIGTVFAGQTDTLELPRTMVARGTVTLFARLLARSETPASGAIAVQPGARYEVRLAADRRSMLVLPAS